MPCKKCLICKCNKPSIYNHDYDEFDPSPDATLQNRWLTSPSTFFERECALNPSSTHCRITEV